MPTTTKVQHRRTDMPKGCLVAAGAFGCLAMVMVAALSTILHGFAFSVLWGWFAVPVFSAPPLSIPAGIGLCALGGLASSYQSSGSDDPVKVLAVAVWRLALALAAGWIAKSFI